MTIGTGIAIAGIWLFVGACSISKSVTSAGWFIAIAIAIVLTAIIA